MTRYFYSGDVDARQGGLFYETANAKHDYASVVRIQPTSDAGGPPNLFWVEELTVNLPKIGSPKFFDALHCSGTDLAIFNQYTTHWQVRALIEMTMIYGSYDCDTRHLVRIGPVDPFFKATGAEDFGEPTKILRAGSSIRNFARKLCP